LRTPRVASLPGGVLTGEVVSVGRGCPANSLVSGMMNPADPYLASAEGKIALVKRGGCRYRDKIDHAVDQGAVGVIVHDNVDGPSVLMPASAHPEVAHTSTPAMFVSAGTGALLANAKPPVTVTVTPRFDGWGKIHL